MRINNFGSDEQNQLMKEIQESQSFSEAEEARQVSTEIETERIEDLMYEDESDGQENLVDLTNLKASDGTGDFVFGLEGQTGTGTDDKFKHVHVDWVAFGCITFEQAMEQLCKDKEQIQDVKIPLNQIKAVVTNNDKLGFEFPDGQTYIPTDKALADIAVIGQTSQWFLSDMVNPKVSPTKKDKITGEKVQLYTRDRLDAQLLVDVMNGTLFRPDRVDQKKVRLFRTWKDGTLRAVLSKDYAIINNEWVLNLLKELIPGGLVSHWRGDADTLYGNILIPDTIRQEPDSEYGGMISFGNSEIGLRKVVTQPSAFRAICKNGCIWDSVEGVSVNKRHYGSIDLGWLRDLISNNIQKQIPLLNTVIDKLLELRKRECISSSNKVVPMRNIFAEVANRFKLSRTEATGIFDKWFVEEKILSKRESHSAFGVQAAITRYGQTVSNDDWLKFDVIGGDLCQMKESTWEHIVDRANSLNEDDVNDAFLVKKQ